MGSKFSVEVKKAVVALDTYHPQRVVCLQKRTESCKSSRQLADFVWPFTGYSADRPDVNVVEFHLGSKRHSPRSIRGQFTSNTLLGVTQQKPSTRKHSLQLLHSLCLLQFKVRFASLPV